MERRGRIILVVGDLTTLALVTAYGFATHGELSSAGMRLLTTFIPLAAAWFLVSPFTGAYNLHKAIEPRGLWRPTWAMILAGPMAAWLRGLWLNRPILPVFIAILTGVSAAAILLWRIIYWLISSRLS